jgi:pimeloyl-ACP methyl ester carboxylesterase
VAQAAPGRGRRRFPRHRPRPARLRAQRQAAAYDIRHLADELAGLLDALGLERAVFCGHDWGGLVLWELPVLIAGRVAGLIDLNTPHRLFRRMGADPIGWLRANRSLRNYMVAYQEPGVEATLAPEMLPLFFDALFRTRSITMAEVRAGPADLRNLELEARMAFFLRPDPPGRRLLAPEELRVYVDAFAAGGFTGPINWYRKIGRNAQILAGTTDRIALPCLMIAAEDDIYLPPEGVEKMGDYIPDLETRPTCSASAATGRRWRLSARDSAA